MHCAAGQVRCAPAGACEAHSVCASAAWPHGHIAMWLSLSMHTDASSTKQCTAKACSDNDALYIKPQGALPQNPEAKTMSC